MGCLSIFNSNKIISNISANGALLYMVMYVRETFGTRVPNVLRRCAPYKGKALAPHGGYSCYVGGASSDSRAPKPRIAWSVGLFPRSILLVGISSQTLKTQKLPTSRSEVFRRRAHAGALVLRDGCDGRDDVLHL